MRMQVVSPFVGTGQLHDGGVGFSACAKATADRHPDYDIKYRLGRDTREQEEE